MDSAQLEIFILLSETLNFSRTANELFISQPYVSKQIAKLEEEWKIKLFERNHHNVDLTPAGDIMLEYAKISKHQLSDALYRAHSLSEHIGVQLRFGVLSQMNTHPPEPLLTFLDTGITYSIGITYRTDTGSDIVKDFASLPWTQHENTL